MERKGQKWILETLLGVGGLDILHPESQGTFEQFGYNHNDLKRVFSIPSGSMMTKSWVKTAEEVEAKGKYAEKRGFHLTARDLYLRASLLYGRSQYTYFRDDPRKNALHNKLVECYEKVIKYTATPVERVQVPFEGKTVHCVLHLPAGKGKVPCVLMLPGMDMFKEDWHVTAQREYLPRGMAVMALDGPGQGETLLQGLKATADNYEKAAKAVIDYLVKRPEIDPGKIGLYGTSMGSYWGTRVAAYDQRVKACATSMGCYGTMEIIFNLAQPNFKVNFMYMAGIGDEKEFDEKVAKHMHLKDAASKVKCPYLMQHGEFDELCPPEDALAHYESVKAPKEIRVYEDEFHPLGGSAAEMISSTADWLLQMLEGKYKPDMDNRILVSRHGTYQEGAARPRWWLA
jgi:dipeptidyl aminopeptidase/acylaminoacyl peptidase